MAHQRGISNADIAKEPHSVSLKVLRLSRPSLSVQHPLPTPPSSAISTPPSVIASHAFPSSKLDPFILSPLLTLPPAFGSAYVGETFSCTLCANNEILPGSTTPKGISNVRIEAEMKIPSSSTPVSLVLGPDVHSSSKNEEGGTRESGKVEGEEKGGVEEKKDDGKKGVDLQPGESLQRIVNFDLKEEGSHVLSVTVTYSETAPTSGRIRSFRKLYQFVCKGCMVVRTKTGVLSEEEGNRKWALEAQLENTGEDTITLDLVVLETRDGFKATGLNWEVDGFRFEKPILMPGDVRQVCFLVEEVGEGKKQLVDGRLVFGILSLGWRGQMGNRGFLSTGNLGARVK